MPVSGMASLVASVATRTWQGRAMPTPPPMVIPSIRTMVGLG